ncbi:hypothetical protein SUGI_0352700 [Cryptomeria japonica]|nr:hypothetical protein SUGI_0352700 [Cryptomeria japonica]
MDSPVPSIQGLKICSKSCEDIIQPFLASTGFLRICVDYRGILACLDGYMNIAMEQTEEYVNGQLKNKYGDAFIRGNNVLYISTSKRTLAEGA